MMKEYDTGVPNMTSGQWLTLLLQILQKSKVLLTESERKQIFQALPTQARKILVMISTTIIFTIILVWWLIVMSPIASIPFSNHNNHGLITFIQIQLHEADPRAFFSPHQDSLSVNWDTDSTFSMWRYASDIVCLTPVPFACHCHEGSISDLNIAEMSTVRWTFCLMMSSFWSSVYRHLLSIVANNS